MSVEGPSATSMLDPDVAAADHPEPGATSDPTHLLSPRPVAFTKRRHNFTWRLVAVGLVLLGAVAFLLAKGLGGSLNYFETVDQAVPQRAELAGKTIRLEGIVQPGSRQDIAGGVEFWADGAHDKVFVINHGSPPQLFQDGIPVVVQGHFAGSVFVSDQIIVDHTNQYIEQHPSRVKGLGNTPVH